MPYCSASDVATWSQNILGGASTFSSSTSPTSSAVDAWMSSGCSVIESFLGSLDYDMPAGAGAAVYKWLTDLNALYAAARVELSRTNISVGPGERTRGQIFDSMFWRDLKGLGEIDLTTAGLTRRTGGQLYVGGTSQDEKDTWDTDTDRVPPRFRRGQFDFPGTERPSFIAAS